MAEETPPLRIGHAERDRAIALLQEHTTAGRLDLDEFEERIEQVTRARTTSDLAAVMADLPAIRTPAGDNAYVAALGAPQGAAPGWGPGAAAMAPRWPRRTGLPGWMSLSLLMVAIWAMAGFGYFWPIWVIVPTAFGAFGSCGRRRVGPSGQQRAGGTGHGPRSPGDRRPHHISA